MLSYCYRALDEASAGLGSVAYEQETNENARKRRPILFLIALIVFIGGSAGIIVYQLLNRPITLNSYSFGSAFAIDKAVSQKTLNQFYDIQRDQSVTCDCSSQSLQGFPSNIDVSQSWNCEYVLNASIFDPEGNFTINEEANFTSFCNKVDSSLANLYLSVALVGGSTALDYSGYIDYWSGAFYQYCLNTLGDLYSNPVSSPTEQLYLAYLIIDANGIGQTMCTLDSPTLAKLLPPNLAKEWWNGNNPDTVAEYGKDFKPDFTPLPVINILEIPNDWAHNYYEYYILLCNPKFCTYYEESSTWSVLLNAAGTIGTLLSVVLTVAAFIYGFSRKAPISHVKVLLTRLSPKSPGRTTETERHEEPHEEGIERPEEVELRAPHDEPNMVSP